MIQVIRIIYHNVQLGLAVNVGKTMYMLSTSRDVETRITADNYTFDTVKEFTADTNKTDVSVEIKRPITLANRCYCGLNGQLSKRDLSLRQK